MSYSYGLDKKDFAIHHDADVKNFQRVRELNKKGSKTSQHLAIDLTNGKEVALNFFNVDQIFERYLLTFQKNFPPQEAREKATQAVNDYVNAQEAIAQRVHHLQDENIARIYEFRISEDERAKPYLISEYVPGDNFFAATRGFNPMQMISLFIPLLKALDFMHQNKLLHLNLKPSKIRVNAESRPPVVKLTDFGQAFPFGEKKPIYSTALYMSPEAICQQYDQVAQTSDLYSFAVIAYQALTEHFPFPERIEAHDYRPKLIELVQKEDAPTPLTFYNKDIPQELNDIILKLLQSKIEERKFLQVKPLLAYFFSKWPEESKSMPFSVTTTMV